MPFLEHLQEFHLDLCIPILEKVHEMKIVDTDYIIIINIVSKIQPYIRYMLGDMIPPS